MMRLVLRGTLLGGLMLAAGPSYAVPSVRSPDSALAQAPKGFRETLIAASDEPAPPGARADPSSPVSSSTNAPPSDEPGGPTADEPGTAGHGEEPSAPEARTPDEPEKPAPVVAEPKKKGALYGLGVHIRAIFVPEWMMNIFVEKGAPLNSVAFGAEAVRRKNNLDIIASIDFGFYGPSDGNWLEKGGIPSEETDYLNFRGLNALAFAVHLIKHEQILPWLSFTWGGGLGFAVVMGNIYRASSSRSCTRDNIGDLSQCRPIGMDANNPDAWVNDPGNRGTEAEDGPDNPKLYREDSVPPVVPLIHLLLGFNFKISEQFSVRVDGGFRNAFYVGTTGHYFF